MSTRRSIRGRKREARRWRDAVLARIFLTNPMRRRFRVYERLMEWLRKRDPSLYQAVEQCIIKDDEKLRSFTREQWVAFAARQTVQKYQIQREFVRRRFGLKRWYSEFKR